MKIRKDLIGAKVKSLVLNQWFTIEAGKEETYKAIGLDVFEKESPKLVKNAKDKKISINTVSGNSNGIDDNSESEVSL